MASGLAMVLGAQGPDHRLLPKMFVPFITILPGMIAAVLVSEVAKVQAGGEVVGRRIPRATGSPSTTHCSA